MKKINEAKLISKDEEVQEKLDDEIKVHNMPPLSTLSGSSYEEEGKTITSSNNLDFSDEEKADKHRKLGFVIIILGLIIIGAIIFLAYKQFIAPNLESKGPLVELEEESGDLVREEKDLVEKEAIDSSEILMPEFELMEEELGDELELEEEETEFLDLFIADSDNDGLSDAAEMILGTDPYSEDSDGDSYLDREEILSGYSPIGLGTLEEELGLLLFKDPEARFVALYSKIWEPSYLEDDSSVLFFAPSNDGSFIQISYQAEDHLFTDILDWHQTYFPEESLGQINLIESSFGPGLLNEEETHIYFLDRDRQHVLVMNFEDQGSGLIKRNFIEMATTLLRP